MPSSRMPSRPSEAVRRAAAALLEWANRKSPLRTRLTEELVHLFVFDLVAFENSVFARFRRGKLPRCLALPLTGKRRASLVDCCNNGGIHLVKRRPVRAVSRREPWPFVPVRGCGSRRFHPWPRRCGLTGTAVPNGSSST